MGPSRWKIDGQSIDEVRRHDEAIGSMPKGLKKGSAVCRWMERVDEAAGSTRKKRSQRGLLIMRTNERRTVDWIDDAGLSLELADEEEDAVSVHRQQKNLNKRRECVPATVKKWPVECVPGIEKTMKERVRESVPDRRAMRGRRRPRLQTSHNNKNKLRNEQIPAVCRCRHVLSMRRESPTQIDASKKKKNSLCVRKAC